jgi:hypothetical protein
MMLGIGGLLTFGAVCVAMVSWLCSREFVWSRRAGVLLASLVAVYCGGIALILTVGSIDARESLRPGGPLSVVAFTVIAGSAIVSARRGLSRNSHVS